ncbi:glycosyltransferase family 9 protein [Mangrovimonas cancribranchiae]|uniref:Glycosyltransferase family 9 protein n=1 Tax=Mangrovimonas cancribranchiae TaxID=3080055 RepID=A0AAU6NYE8_9FLAO
MNRILFLHDTGITLKRGAELTLTQLISYGDELGFLVELNLLENFKITKEKIAQSNIIIVSSTSRCQFEIELLQYIINSNKPYVKLEYDYNFCVRRNLLCLSEKNVKNCCNNEKYHLYRNLFANARLNVFQSPKHYQYHYDFFGEAIGEHLIMPPTVDVDNLQISKEKLDQIPFFGTLNNLKGGYEFVDYAVNHPDKQFVVYGENKLQVDIPKNIKFKSPIENKEVLNILGKTKTIIIKPVWPEPSGRLAAEAFLSDCEIITNDKVGTWSFNFYPDDKAKALKAIKETIPEFWNNINLIQNQELDKEQNKSLGNVLVKKSYGGLGDIFFTIPAVYKLKAVSQKVTYALAPRLVNFFKTYLNGVAVISSKEIETKQYDTIIELGNHPKFNYEVNQIEYITGKKLKQHSIKHYIDGVARLHANIENNYSGFPYFKRDETALKSKKYFTVHPGAGFILKAWPITYFAKLIEQIHNYYPELEVQVIQGPKDPDISPYLSRELSFKIIDGGIEDVAKAVSGAMFHIGNDSGITHLAGAFNCPILTIYGPTGPGSWGAYSENVELIWGKKGHCNLTCNYNVIINCEDRVCLNNVLPNRLFYRLQKLLDKLGFTSQEIYYYNTEFQLKKEKNNSYVFKNLENEYLLEFSDEESQHYFSSAFNGEIINTKNMPEQFREMFSSLVSLDIFTPMMHLK